MATPEIAQPAPDFELAGILLKPDGSVEKSTYRLSEHRGSPVVLAFYPGDETPVCTKQMCAYTSELAQFNALGAQVWGVSPQDVASHEKFARKEGLHFPLLADTDKLVVKLYGIALPGLGLRRSTFIVDSEGVLRWKNVSVLGLNFDKVDVLTKQLHTLAT